MATTVTSDAEFKTYVEGLTAFTTDTVYMNDDSKYWTFTRENNGKINAMCVTSNNVELWLYDGTDWVINRVPSVINNLTNTSINDALSANQGKVLNEKIPPVINNLTSTSTTSALSANQGKVLKDLLGAFKATWTSSGSFPGLLSSNGDCYLIVAQRLSLANAIVLIANRYNDELYCATVYKGDNMSYVTNNQGTVQINYNGSGTGVLGAAFRLRAG